MLEALRPALYIARREIHDQLRDWRVIFPVVGLTVFFPFLMNFTAQQMLDFVNQYGASLIGERLVPFLMMIVGFFPISVSLVIALDSFVGEKERGSIEPLLNTPLDDWQLYLGKLLAATVPPLFASFLGMSVYIIGLIVTDVPLPPAGMMVLIFVLTIAQALMMVSGAVVVSTQATSIRSANLLSSFIIIPAALLIQGESIVMFWGDFGTLWWAVFGLIVISILLIRVGLAHFHREDMLGREIDVLNFRWGWKVFTDTFKGGATTLRDWYKHSIPATLRKLRWPFWIMVVLAIAGGYIGMIQIERFNIPLDQTGLETIGENLQSILQVYPVFSFLPVLAIWWQNVRVLLFALLLGAISFGILGVLPIMLTMGITGYLMALLNVNGISPLQYFLGLILPHGVIEIPAALLAAAAVLQAGALLATPDRSRTVGEVWLASLGEWAKVMVGVVIPLLFVAACVEAWVTPRIAIWLMPLLQ